MTDAPERNTDKPQAHPPWHWRHMLGLIGLSVAGFTLAGAGLGIWMDYRYPGMHSWTLMLVIAGAAAGCLNARQRVVREQRAIRGALERAAQAERERAEQEMAERQARNGQDPGPHAPTRGGPPRDN